MKVERDRRHADAQEKKENVLTSGGPTMEIEDTAAIEKKFKDQ